MHKHDFNIQCTIAYLHLKTKHVNDLKEHATCACSKTHWILTKPSFQSQFNQKKTTSTEKIFIVSQDPLPLFQQCFHFLR
jgi:hypothetical protein